MLTQGQTVGNRTSTVVRIPVGETHLVKQVLDLGIQTVMVPMIESAAHAEQMALRDEIPARRRAWPWCSGGAGRRFWPC